jgi:hypothetical protein
MPLSIFRLLVCLQKEKQKEGHFRAAENKQPTHCAERVVVSAATRRVDRLTHLKAERKVSLDSG